MTVTLSVLHSCSTVHTPPSNANVAWGTGYWVWGTGYGVPGMWYQVWGTGYGVPGMGYRVRGTGYGVPGTGYRVLGEKKKLGVLMIINFHLASEL